MNRYIISTFLFCLFARLAQGQSSHIIFVEDFQKAQYCALMDSLANANEAELRSKGWEDQQFEDFRQNCINVKELELTSMLLKWMSKNGVEGRLISSKEMKDALLLRNENRYFIKFDMRMEIGKKGGFHAYPFLLLLNGSGEIILTGEYGDFCKKLKDRFRE